MAILSTGGFGFPVFLRKMYTKKETTVILEYIDQ